jgi:hypothetical protein
MTAELLLLITSEPGLRGPSTRSRSPKWIPFLTFLNCALGQDRRRYAQASLAKGQPLLDCRQTGAVDRVR